MTTAIDTTVLIAFWGRDDTLNSLAQLALDASQARGPLVISAPVYAELLSFPLRTEAFLDSFCRETGIRIEWEMNETVWRAAGRAFQSYAIRRKKQREAGPRRILADFLIGAHALRNGYRLLTLDDRLYRAAFPRLSIVAI